MVVRDMLVHLGAQTLGVVAVGAAAYFLTRVLGFRHRTWTFASARESSLWGIGAVLIGWLLVSALFLLVTKSQASPQSPVGHREYNANDVIGQAILACIAWGPAVLVMRRRRESWASVGVSAHDLGRSLIVGILPIVFSALVNGRSSERGFGVLAAGLTAGHFWGLLRYATVGFGEEFAFRGYLQTRLVAWLGRWQGWVVASLLMALGHVVQRITMVGLSPLDAALSSLSLMPLSLLLGYVMLRTGNVVAPGLFHTFANWLNTLT